VGEMAELMTKPEIRFAGFTDAWEQRAVREIAEQTYGGGTPKTSVSEYWTGDIPWIQSSDLTENEVCGVVPRKHISSSGIIASTTKLIPKNSIAIITRVGVGKLALMPYCYASSQDFLSLSRLKINAQFAAYSLYKKLRGELHIVQGTSIKGITKEELISKAIMVPCQTDEQYCIGKLFTDLDRLITLHQREYDNTVNIKKAMLEKMFPKEGADRPEIRFAGFTDAWEQRKLGDMADIVRGASPRPIKDPKWFDDKSDIGWLRISDVTEQDGRIYHLEQRISELGQEKTRVLTEVHILLSIAATVGKPLINYVKTGVHDGFLIFQNPKFDREFMFQWLEMFRPKWQKYGQPGSQVNLNSDLVKSKDIMLPNEKEQRQIGELFANLDRLITLHQRELKKLQNIKKALLEKMFV
jgi:type I restriction enzyme S subunit